MGKGKPKCPWKPPFSCRDDGEFYYLEDSGVEKDGEALNVTNNYPEEKARLDAYCYTLNLAYPVRRSSKRAKGGRK